MYEDGEQIGMATEAVRELLLKSGVQDYTISTYPLARGVVELQSGRVDIFYPYIADEKTDTSKFIIIGPIAKYRVGLFVPSNYELPVSLDAMQEMVLSAERGGVAARLLKSRNMHVELATQKINCLKMALSQRVVACAVGTLPGMYEAAINNLYQEFKFVETGVYADIFVALGPSLAPESVAAIKATFDKLKKERFFEKQQKDYEKKFKIFIESLA